ncbi:MAG: hypothetical protein J7L39_04305 [Candidatus Aenigmarchaeota archaeon]|nr:hypothetical protein [Candidatus Aenigmarchaeota archaeon]
MNKLKICSENYQRWKKLVLKSEDLGSLKRAAKRAFFWIELQLSFMILEDIERKAITREEREKILRMKMNLIKKLTSYAKESIKEFF